MTGFSGNGQPQTLGEWLGEVAGELADLPRQRLTIDSRQVEAHDWFILAVTDNDKAQRFYTDAVARQPALIIAPEDVLLADHEVPVVHVPQLLERLGILISHYFGEPSHSLCLTGITGTNGKTSVSQFLANALAELGKPCGVLGTLGYGFPDKMEVATHTTPDVLRVHQLLNGLQAQGATDVAMEVSSHALMQGRVGGVLFDTAVFTNLTRDHLDYHGTMEAYAKAKQLLFVSRGLKRAVINLDDPWAADFIKALPASVELVTFAREQDASVHLSLWQPHAQGMSLCFQTPSGQIRFDTPLLGSFNVSNLLAVAAVLYARGFSHDDIASALSALQRVPGRMESFGGENKPLLVVDYAHTPDALEKALTALREHVRGQLWCIFGCGGDRDRGKRPLMAEAASQADHVILTQDNPRTESPAQIIADTRAGFAQGQSYDVIEDRSAAIHETFIRAKAGDVILIAGKGHEDYQDIQGIKHPYSDRDIARQLQESAS
ncbi:UDP-N-acetylmuramoyl-L-alanyl-D-glutamate--2,6-diaminopimelate ligase [Pokkaliibacter sp. CJK22405]|uniref:UDP-N-acetylmuramoyl-L-alanyl-D-glutamate--2, 6-diaminopimelate ligase n=1 Tax=Pokkaliibacter sp. CJK22405 TaxID=3384615 RepID=UPI00398515F3